MSAKTSVFINRVKLTNYKSIARCDVKLDTLTYLIGPNGAGKSNFLDALRFIADSLRTTLDHALRDRGGIKEVRRRSNGHPTHFAMEIHFELPTRQTGVFSFRIGAKPDGGYSVQAEECRIHSPEVLKADSYYRVENGRVVESSLAVPPASADDRLFLVNASGFGDFKQVYDAFSHIALYSLNPEQFRRPQFPDAGELLARDGGNITSVLNRITLSSEETKKRIEEYLAKVVPGITSVETKNLGPMETLEFKQEVKGARYPWSYFAQNMSDGTLRALGVLTAVFQNYDDKRNVSLVALEEPELALHPGAAGVLRDVLIEGSQHTQIIVTSHSAELLDAKTIQPEQILGVVAEYGETKILPINPSVAEMIREQLFTAGELLRFNKLLPENDKDSQQLAVPFPEAP
jgi:predicted ATPase